MELSPKASRALIVAIVGWVLLTCGWAAFATREHFYDEKFSIANVQVLLEEGSLEPDNAWYGRLSYLPQAGVLAGYRFAAGLVGGEPPELFRPRGGLTRNALTLVRLFTVLCGAASVLLTFWIGRRLFSPGVGLLGAALLATCPWLIRHFLTFKGDALNTFLVLVAFWWSLDAAERPTLRRWALAGAGVGLAAASKYTGATIAITLVVAAALGRDALAARFKRLCLAGIASVVVFALLHLDFMVYWSFFTRSTELYSTKQTVPFTGMLLEQGRMFLHWSFYGPWVGTLVLIAVAALYIRLARIDRRGAAFRDLAMFLSFPLGYTLVYALVTSIPKGNNYLVLLPFTSLAAAWWLSACWAWIRARVPATGHKWIFWPALLGLLLLVALPAHAYIYKTFVPWTTLERAEDVIKGTSFLKQRVAVFEADVGSLAVSSRPQSASTYVWSREVSALTGETFPSLDKVDYELFPEERLDGPESDFYRRRMERLVPRRVLTFRSQWFRTYGPSLVLLMHPWYPAGPAEAVEWTSRKLSEGRFAGRLPESLGRLDLISLDVTLPRGRDVIESFTIGGIGVEPIEHAYDPVGRYFMTERFHVTKPRLKLRLQFGEPWDHESPPRVEVWRWQRHKLLDAGEEEGEGEGASRFVER